MRRPGGSPGATSCRAATRGGGRPPPGAGGGGGGGGAPDRLAPGRPGSPAPRQQPHVRLVTQAGGVVRDDRLDAAHDARERVVDEQDGRTPPHQACPAGPSRRTERAPVTRPPRAVRRGASAQRRPAAGGAREGRRSSPPRRRPRRSPRRRGRGG